MEGLTLGAEAYQFGNTSSRMMSRAQRISYGAVAYQLGNTSSCTINEVKQHF